MRFTLFLLFSNSFDQNGFYTNPKHLVGHSYVIFEGDRSPPVYLYFRIFRWNWVHIWLYWWCLFLVSDAIVFYI
jgi:hypothetical protein